MAPYSDNGADGRSGMGAWEIAASLVAPRPLHLVYLGAPGALDMPSGWAKALSIGLHYYVGPAMELQRRHDVCFMPYGTITQPVGTRCSQKRPASDAIILGWSVWDWDRKRLDDLKAYKNLTCPRSGSNGQMADVAGTATAPPVIALMNKEYRHAAGKQTWVRLLSVSRMLTVLDTERAQHWEIETQSRVSRWHFAVDPALTSPNVSNVDDPYEYDIGFTGIVRPSQTENWREQVLLRLEKLAKRTGLRLFINKAIYSEKQGGIVNSYKALSREEYLRKMRQTKIWLSTTGPSDIVGTRFFEVIATGRTMLICNRMPAVVYDGIIVEGKHAAMFSTADEFEERVLHYLSDEGERRRVVAQARQHALAAHSYARRVDQIEELIAQSKGQGRRQCRERSPSRRDQ